MGITRYMYLFLFSLKILIKESMMRHLSILFGSTVEQINLDMFIPLRTVQQLDVGL